jgi:cell division protein FtsI (penicillin-binding protein 3)
MVKPKFIEEIREDGIPVRKFKTEVINPSICSKETLDKAQALLIGVVEQGTGRNLRNPYYTLAGKTGTAVIANEDKGYTTGGAKKYQASFCGYFPAKNPEFSIIVVIVGPKGKFYGGSVAGPVFRGIADKVYASYLEPAPDSIPPYNEVPLVKPGLKEDVMLFTQNLGFKTQSQNMTAERVAIAYDTMTVYVSGVSDIPGLLPDVIGMGAGDAVYLLEKSGYKTKTNGFGRVFRQSPRPGTPCVKGDLIALELGFDELEMVKRDSIANADSIQGPVLSAVPIEQKTKEEKKPTAPVVVKKSTQSSPKAKSGKAAAEKPKPTQEAINKWKAKVAAQKALEKKKKSATKKNTTKPKKPQQ